MQNKTLTIGKNTKYVGRNPIARYLIRRFVTTIDELLGRISFASILEAGCGEGLLLAQIQRSIEGKRVVAIDVDEEEIQLAKNNIPFAECSLGNIYRLPFDNREFDLVLCCEVLEHLENPKFAIAELKRVAKRYVIFSVPNEPLWRILNLARGCYFRSFGNTPGHVNHWSTRSFRRFMETEFRVVDVRTPVPWICVMCDRDETDNTLHSNLRQ